MNKINLLLLLATSLLLVACSDLDESDKTITDEEFKTKLDEIREVESEEFARINEERFNLWRANATSLKNDGGLSRYSLDECRDLMLSSCDEHIEDSDFNIDTSDEIIDYYIKTREVESINKANKKLKDEVKKSFENEKWKLEMYIDFADKIEIYSHVSLLD